MSVYTDPHWDTSALITIDVQNDFSLLGARAEIRGTADILPNMYKLASAFRGVQLPIIHVVRLYKEDGSNADVCRRETIENGLRVVVPNSMGSELAEGIQPAHAPGLDSQQLLGGGFQQLSHREWVMYKPR